MYYSYGAYYISTATFNLIGVSAHVWGQWTPWFVILVASVFYLMILLATRFIQYHWYKNLQDEVISCLEN
jgi:hypothetical protein